jgi:hypothetical protein
LSTIHRYNFPGIQVISFWESPHAKKVNGILTGPGFMYELLPDDIKKDLKKACLVHERAVSDYDQCIEFSKLMSDILARLEDSGCYETADQVMKILLNCNPKIGAHCEKSIIVAQAAKKFRIGH